MNQALLSVAAFVVLLALLPWAIRWLQRRGLAGLSSSAAPLRLVSALAVGPHERVVTIELGAPDERFCLVLGVTAQSITCLHRIDAAAPAAPASPASFGSLLQTSGDPGGSAKV